MYECVCPKDTSAQVQWELHESDCDEASYEGLEVNEEECICDGRSWSCQILCAGERIRLLGIKIGYYGINWDVEMISRQLQE